MSGTPGPLGDPPPTRYDRGWLKRALRAYVSGHDRGLVAARKLGAVEPEGADRAVERVERSDRAAGPSGLDVPVPDRLDFRRGPGRWRDRLPQDASD